MEQKLLRLVLSLKPAGNYYCNQLMKQFELRRSVVRLRNGFVTAIGLLVGAHATLAADFNVTSPSVFAINGTGGNPTITLVRGRTYTFSISTLGSHPFAIGTSVFGPAPAGVSGNNGSSSGTITFAVPTDAADCVYYCTIHGFSGDIAMVDPPVPLPPAVRITDIVISSNIVLRSTGTNTWTTFPEYRTNLTDTNWFALTVQTNRFLNGTNETICGKPDGDVVFIRVRARQN
jgi:hypothetical protein